MLIQVIPLPLDLLKILAPQSAVFYEFTNNSWASISVDPSSTFLSLLWLITLYLFFVINAAIFEKNNDNNSKLRHIMKTIRLFCVCLGIFLSVYGLLAYLNSYSESLTGTLLNRVPFRAKGPLANPNHYALYLNMCLIFSGLNVLQLVRKGPTKTGGYLSQYFRT